MFREIPEYSRWSGLLANRLITAWACTARSHLEVSGALVIGSTRRCVVWCVGVSVEPALSTPARHNARYVVVAWITTPVNAAVVITRSRLLRESDYLFRDCCSRCRFQSSSASSSRFSPPSSFVNGHVSTMWFMVCRWPQSQEGDWARPHLCKLAWYEPWPVRKRFIRNSLFDAGKGISGVTYLNMPGLDGARSTFSTLFTRGQERCGFWLPAHCSTVWKWRYTIIIGYGRCSKVKFATGLINYRPQNFQYQLESLLLIAGACSRHRSYLLPEPALSSKPATRRCCSTGQTDGRTPDRYIDCSAQHAGMQRFWSYDITALYKCVYYYYFLTPVLNSQGVKKLRYAIQ